MTSLQARIDAMRDELVHHRADGYATTTDVLRLLELVDEVRGVDRKAVRQRVARLLAVNDEADRATDGRF